MNRSSGTGMYGALAAVMMLVVTALAPAEVTIEIESFGVANNHRPGGIVPLRVALTYSGAEQAQSAWVQWEVANADGDIGEYGRPVTLNIGSTKSVWLYAPVPPSPPLGTVWWVRVFEMQDGQRGKEIGGLRIAPTTVGEIPLEWSAIGVVGTRRMGLGVMSRPQAGTGEVFTANENTRLVWGLGPQDFPDRWEGLSMFESIVWSDLDPGQLNEIQTDALKAWIRRGGHLAVVLPTDTNPWQLGEPGANFFSVLLPTKAPRAEVMALPIVLPVLSKAKAVEIARPRSIEVGLRVFRDFAGDFNAIDNGYEPVITLPPGQVVVVRRNVGHGWITLIGIELSDTLASGLPLSHGVRTPLPQGDIFWNRVLGRRADTPVGGEITQIADAKLLVTSSPRVAQIGTGGLINQEINLTGQAGSGLFMAFGLFLLYWIVAGPGSYFVLKHYKRAHHAWLVFAGASAVFTALAWFGVNLIRQGEPVIRHITVLDRIYENASKEGDPQLDRATSWFSLYTPGYGNTVLSIASDTAQPLVESQAHRDQLLSWTAPNEPTQPFPNVDRYRVDLDREPDTYALPSRSTATRLHANWLGSLDAEWGGTISAKTPIVAVDGEAAKAREVRRTISGTLTHDLPGTLENVLFIWIQNDRARYRYAPDGDLERPWVNAARDSGQMPNLGRIAGLGQWAAGTSIDLTKLGLEKTTADYLLEPVIETDYQKPFVTNSFSGAPGSLPTSEGDRRRYLEMLSIFQMLKPPVWLRSSARNEAPASVMAQRFLGRELDLSMWLTRPCLIVIGFLPDSANPIPLRANGEQVESEGTTMVRWIYPLPTNVEDTLPSVVQAPAEAP